MSENLRQSLSALMDGEADELEVRRLLGELDKSGSGQGDTGQGEELRGSWSRYQRARSVMKNDHATSFSHIDLSQGLVAAIEQEPGLATVQARGEQTPTGSLPAWLKPISGMAIAASVAMITVFGVSQYQTLAPGQAMPSASTSVASVAQQPSAQLTNPSRLAAVSPASTSPTTRAVSPRTPSAGRLLQLGGERYAMPASYSSEKVSLSEGIQQAQTNQLIARQRLDAYLLRHAEHAALNNSQGMMPLARVARFE